MEDHCDSADLYLTVPRSLVRDVLLGPKVLAELAILRRLAD